LDIFSYQFATVFRNFSLPVHSQTSLKLSPQELVKEINTCFEAFDGIIEKYDIEKKDDWGMLNWLPVAYLCPLMNQLRVLCSPPQKYKHLFRSELYQNAAKMRSF
jgi:hypothetical protein